jgi:WD40 repeat protein
VNVRVIESPYKGLAAFDDSDLDALLFFGRERETQTIAANLQAARLTILFGPTGVGKSSILRAGVAYRLRKEPDIEVEILDSWEGDPVAALRAASANRNGHDLYLILDQFEEYFVYHGDDEAVAAELGELLEQSRVNVLIGIRDDSLARLDAFKRRLPELLRNRLRLEHLDRRGGEEAIRGPITAYNRNLVTSDRVEIEDELVVAVLDEVAVGRVRLGAGGRGSIANGDSADRIEAPFLQLVLERIWEAERSSGSNRLRLDTFGSLGGAARIVRDHLETAMGELSLAEQEAAAAMYDHLVTPSGTKIAHGVGDLARYAKVSEPEAAAVLEKLASERVLRASSADGAGGRRYEIYHDVLANAVLEWHARHRAQRVIEQVERRRRRAFAVAAAALIALVVVAAVAVFALVERGRARSQTRHARAGQLVAEARSDLDVDPRQSIVLALQAARREHSTQVEDVLRAALIVFRSRAVLRAAPLPVVTPGPGFFVVGDARGRLRAVRGDGVIARQRLLQAAVTAVVVGSDGSIVAGTRDGWVWRVSSRVVPTGSRNAGTKSAPPVSGSVTALALGRRHIAAGSAGGGVAIWRPLGPYAASKCAYGCIGHALRVRGRVKSLAFGPDERLLLVTSRDRSAQLVDTRTGHTVRTFTQAGRINAAALAPNGRFVVTGGADHIATIWTANGRLLHRLADARESITSVAFSPDGREVAVGSSDAVGRVYDVRTGVRILLLLGDTNAVTDVGWSPDGKNLVTASSDQTVQIRNADIGKQIAILRGHSDAVLQAFFTSNGRRVVSAGADGTVRIWDPGTEPELQPLVTQKTPFVAASRRRDGISVVDASGRTVLLDPRAQRVLRVSQGGIVVATRIPTARRGALEARANPLGVVTITRAGHVVGRIDSHGPLTGLALSPDETMLASVGLDHYLRTWDVNTGRELHAVVAHQGRIQGVDFSPDGRWIVTAGPISAGLWAADTGQLVQLLRGPTKPLRAALFTQDGRTIVTAGDDGTIRTYNCVACGTLPELVRVAEGRLAATRPR